MSIEKRVMETIKINLEKKLEVTLESRLVEELEVDSFNKLMILSGLEDEFSITIEAEDFSEIETVRDIVQKLKQAYPRIEGDGR